MVLGAVVRELITVLGEYFLWIGDVAVFVLCEPVLAVFLLGVGFCSLAVGMRA